MATADSNTTLIREATARINWATVDDIAVQMLAGKATAESRQHLVEQVGPSYAVPANEIVDAAIRARLLRLLADARVAMTILLANDTGPRYVVLIACQYDTDGDQQTPEWTTSCLTRTLTDAEAVAAAIKAKAAAMGRKIAWRVNAKHTPFPEVDTYIDHGDLNFRDPASPDVALEVEAWAWHNYAGEIDRAWLDAVTDDRRRQYVMFAAGEGWSDDDEDLDLDILDLDDILDDEDLDDDLDEADALNQL